MTSPGPTDARSGTATRAVDSPRPARSTPARDPEACLAAAATAADAAAHRARVDVRQLDTLAELEAVYRLYDTIWRPDPSNPPVTTELLRALTKAGNYVAGAYDGGTLVGACVGFFGEPSGASLHSHIAGVSHVARGRSIGFALKVHQRHWALRRGAREIAWTFDPLVRRNAYFNLVKLAARAVEYLPNFYGGVRDGINGADDTDRLLVSWPLTDAAVARACGDGAARPEGPPAAQRRQDGRRGRDALQDPAAPGPAAPDWALRADPDGDPVRAEPATRIVRVAVPPDIEALRGTDPELAGAWRTAVRDALTSLLTEGGEIAGFDRHGWYLVRRGPGPAPAPGPRSGPSATP